MPHSRALFFLLCAAAFFCPPGMAGELEDTKLQMAQSRQQEQDFKQKRLALEAELNDLQKKLVSLAAKIRKGEAELSAAEDKLKATSEEVKRQAAELAARKERLSTLIQLSLRFSRMPPEAIVMMPGDMATSMKAARAVKVMGETIRAEMTAVQEKIRELKELEQKLTEQRAALAKKQGALDAERKELKAKAAERRKLSEDLGRKERKAAEKAAQLAKKAADLQSLMSGLEKAAARRDEEDEDSGGPVSAAEKGKMRPFAKAKGRISLPVSGKMTKPFGVSQGGDEWKKGVFVATRKGAQVVAPYDGEVVFSGPFLSYGRLVILRHADGFHTLLAGIKKIDARVGEFLLEGEPIGAMGDRDTETRLYLELRRNNQPVDPEPWIGALK